MYTESTLKFKNYNVVVLLKTQLYTRSISLIDTTILNIENLDPAV